jgi:type IX secretion system PorP/SprF family membrane protein
MKKNILLSILLSILVFTKIEVFAQQDPYITHYAFNRMLYNPAAAGAGQRYCLTALTHYQYTGYEDRTPELYDASKVEEPVRSVGPKTQMFSFSAPITKYGGLGIGFINDKLGYESSTHVKIDAAGRIPLASGATIALGFEANLLQKGIEGGRLKPLALGDPSIPTTTVKDMHPVFGAGVYYSDPMESSVSNRNLWVGLSVLNLNSPTFQFSTPGGNSITYSTPERHIHLMGGITMIDFLGNPNLKFHPSAKFKRAGVNQIDLTGLVEYQDKLWGGLAYRSTSDALSILLGYSGFKGKLQGLRVGYSYDLTLSRILNVSSGSHELQLNYCFDIKIDPPKKINILTPPFMNRQSD